MWANAGTASDDVVREVCREEEEGSGMTTTSVPTFTATIYVGCREQYTPEIRSIEKAYEVIQELANQGGLCVSVTPTRFIYKNGSEPGFAVGLINYPRFPETNEALREKALSIADLLRRTFYQFKVSVVFPDETVMVE